MPICNSICALCKHYDSDACLYCLITDDAEGGMEFSNYEYIGGTQTMPEIKDSGERTIFETGGQRDMAGGKGDCVSLPAAALLRLSLHYEAGAKKYGRWNYQKGIPVSSFIDSAMRHLLKYLDGWDDEDHLAAAAFNVLGALQMEETMPGMQDLPSRKNCKVPHYPGEQHKKDGDESCTS